MSRRFMRPVAPSPAGDINTGRNIEATLALPQGEHLTSVRIAKCRSIDAGKCPQMPAH
ncbi:hypothetical protein [Paraburkholderia sp. GAS334]|uniref:hypothetical protein n=1 Tax=Paraburkholderia sp. GAS334 TaxID=3035131 RepID=UPI003D243879